MYKRRIIMAVMMAVCFMTACVQKPDSKRRIDIRSVVEEFSVSD